MTATKLIEIAAAKGYSIGRYKKNIYRYGYVAESGYIDCRFHGTHNEFVAFVKALEPQPYSAATN